MTLSAHKVVCVRRKKLAVCWEGEGEGKRKENTDFFCVFHIFLLFFFVLFCFVFCFFVLEEQREEGKLHKW